MKRRHFLKLIPLSIAGCATLSITNTTDVSVVPSPKPTPKPKIKPIEKQVGKNWIPAIVNHLG